MILIFSLASCGSFKAERVDGDTSDEKAMEITDKWVSGGTSGSLFLEDNDRIVVNYYGIGSGGRGPTLEKSFGKDIGDFDLIFVFL